MITTPYMGLAVWDSIADTWDHEQLADNFRKLDEHNHSGGKGQQVPTGGIKDGAITRPKLAPDLLLIEDGSIETRHLRDLAVTNPKIAFNAVRDEKIADSAVGTRHFQNNSIYSRHFNPRLREIIGLIGQNQNRTNHIQFTPSGDVQIGQEAPAPRANGETDTLKVEIPAGGGVVHFYAQGDFQIFVRSDAQPSDYFIIRVWLEIGTPRGPQAMTVYKGRANNLTANRYATWASYSGSDWARRGDPDQIPGWAPQVAIRSRTRESGSYAVTSGGPVSRYIPAGPDGATVIAKLKIRNSEMWATGSRPGGRYPNSGSDRKDAPFVRFYTQSLTSWVTPVRTESVNLGRY